MILSTESKHRDGVFIGKRDNGMLCQDTCLMIGSPPNLRCYTLKANNVKII